MAIRDQQVYAPHALCPLCDDDRACKFHRATSAKELGEVLYKAMQRNAAKGFVEFLTASIAELDAKIPAFIRDELAKVPQDDLQAQFNDAMHIEKFDSDDLRELAATALALSICIDARQNGNDDEDDEDEGD